MTDEPDKAGKRKKPKTRPASQVLEREDINKFAQDATDEPRAKPLCLGVSDILLDLRLIVAEVVKSSKKGAK
jgi:hypothetical protein